MNEALNKRMTKINEYTDSDGLVIPEHMIGGVARYIEEGIPTGDFLRCIFSNDLMGAYAHADDKNSRRVRTYCMYLYNEVPTNCWGSHEHYLAWINHQGLINKTRGDDYE